jgi:hypothetical protein
MQWKTGNKNNCIYFVPEAPTSAFSYASQSEMDESLLLLELAI